VLNGPYRVALAHAGKVDAGKPLTAASYEDYQKVASQVPVVRYMANVVLENVRATFDAEVGREYAGDQELELPTGLSTPGKPVGGEVSPDR
jgi:hypothetical protein